MTLLTSLSNSLVHFQFNSGRIQLGEFQFTSEVNKNLVHLQSSIQERSQDDLWSGGNGFCLVCGAQSRSDSTH